MTWPRITTGPGAPVDAHGAPAEAAHGLQEAAAALSPEERDALATRGGGWWKRACARTGARFTGNATRCVRGDPNGSGHQLWTDAAVFATAIRRLPYGVAEALHEECMAAARRAREAGQGAFGNVLVALAEFIRCAHYRGDV